MNAIMFTLDLEDHRPGPDSELRFPPITDSLLDDLEEWGVVGTFFVVGDLIRDHSELLKRVAARGHEIGLHGASHVPLPRMSPSEFRREVSAASDLLSQTIQAPVQGFRAPIFSLVPDSAWAPAILDELGFTYSSSVLPARNPLFGWPGAPHHPFRWPSGLIELPCPVFGIGPIALPLLGGTYLRVAPRFLVSWARRYSADDHAVWLYSHPYDYDPDEPRWTVPEVGRLGSRVLWWRRSGMRQRVRRLVEGSTDLMAAVAQSLTDLPIFDPEGAV